MFTCLRNLKPYADDELSTLRQQSSPCCQIKGQTHSFHSGRSAPSRVFRELVGGKASSKATAAESTVFFSRCPYFLFRLCEAASVETLLGDIAFDAERVFFCALFTVNDG